jgi:hypothetical protein
MSAPTTPVTRPQSPGQDSGYGGESETTSLASSVPGVVVRHGRTYPPSDTWPFLDLQHMMFRICLRGKLEEGVYLSYWRDMMMEASERIGASFNNLRCYEQIYRIPIRVLDGFSKVLLVDVLGFSRAALNALLAGVKDDIRNPRIHAYAELFVYGQKVASQHGKKMRGCGKTRPKQALQCKM